MNNITRGGKKDDRKRGDREKKKEQLCLLRKMLAYLYLPSPSPVTKQGETQRNLPFSLIT